MKLRDFNIRNLQKSDAQYEYLALGSTIFTNTNVKSDGKLEITCKNSFDTFNFTVDKNKLLEKADGK